MLNSSDFLNTAQLYEKMKGYFSLPGPAFCATNEPEFASAWPSRSFAWLLTMQAVWLFSLTLLTLRFSK